MQDKKGFSYVDWVISLGTFLIAVVFIFILIRPKLEPMAEKESLMRVVEQGFLKDTEWSIREVPIFVKRLQKEYAYPGGGTQPARIFFN